MTGNDAVRAAFFRAGIRSSETPLAPDELVNGFDMLIDMLNEWQGSGIALNFDQSLSAADVLGVPKESYGAIKAQLAVRINAAYQRPIMPSLMAVADDSYRRMLHALMTLPDTVMPCTAPVGSGNESGFIRDAHFYAPPQDKNF